MNAKIFQIRDYQLKRAVERAHKELEKKAVKILRDVDTSPSEMIPYHGAGIDGMDLGPKPA